MSGVKSVSLKTLSGWKQQTLSDYVTGMAWSPNSMWLATASANGDIELYSQSGKPLTLQQADGFAVNCLGFSADGRFLATGGQASDLIVWDIASDLSMLLRQSYASAWIDTLAWHPSLPYVAYGVAHKIEVLDVEKEQAIATLDFQDSSVLDLAWHPTGDRLAASGHGGVKVWAAADWQAEPKLIAVPGASLCCAWSSDGGYLGSGNLDRTLTVAEWDSPPPWLMQGFPGKVRQVDWSEPSSTSGAPLIAAACAEGVTLWERRGSGQSAWKSTVLQHHQTRVNAIAFQPNSLTLASAGEEGHLVLWREGKKVDQSLKGFRAGIACVAWSPTGSLLAAGGTAGELRVWQITERAKGFG